MDKYRIIMEPWIQKRISNDVKDIVKEYNVDVDRFQKHLKKITSWFRKHYSNQMISKETMKQHCMSFQYQRDPLIHKFVTFNRDHKYDITDENIKQSRLVYVGSRVPYEEGDILTDDLKKKVKEYDLKLPKHSDTCICGKTGLSTNFYLMDKYNHNILILGSKCKNKMRLCSRCKINVRLPDVYSKLCFACKK